MLWHSSRQNGSSFFHEKLWAWPLGLAKVWKILCVLEQNHKKWVPTFLRKKPPRYGYLFWGNLLLNMGIGLELPAAHAWPIQIQINLMTLHSGRGFTSCNVGHHSHSWIHVVSKTIRHFCGQYKWQMTMTKIQKAGSQRLLFLEGLLYWIP